MNIRSWHVDERKFWGWGDPDVRFDHENRPKMWPTFSEELGKSEFNQVPIVREEDIQIAEPNLNNDFMKLIGDVLEETQIAVDQKTRVRHSYGQSYRDLLRLRKGQIDASPDAVLYPKSHFEVCEIMKAAKLHHVCIIPFGGGSNILRMVERNADEQRMVVTVDTKLMNQLIEVDEESYTAKFQAGVFGPDIEGQLLSYGFELGHFPDSYELSTLGGWIASRSAGMFSNSHGKIEDMIVSLKVATPDGTIETRPTPASSAGANINQILAGSEGTMGIITEAVMKVRKIPDVREFQAILFPDFESGVSAIHTMAKQGCLPGLARLYDDKQWRFISSLGHEQSPGQKRLGKVIGWYLQKIKHYNLKQNCMLFLGFEGTKEDVKRQKKRALSICKKYKAFNVGSNPAVKWYEEVFLFGYFRDTVYEYGLIGDAAETATVWSNLLPLYYSTQKAILKCYEELGVQGFCGCHISHVYDNGASIYFIMVCPERDGEELDMHRILRNRVTQAIVDGGGTLSHHHSIGREINSFMEQENGSTVLSALREMKRSIDPGNILNPGTLYPSSLE